MTTTKMTDELEQKLNTLSARCPKMTYTQIRAAIVEIKRDVARCEALAAHGAKTMRRCRNSDGTITLTPDEVGVALNVIDSI